jgi:hypothetical protein
MTTSPINEGNIEYNLQVIDNRNALLTNDMLPATMKMLFKDNKTCFNLSAFGVFSTDLIANSNDSSIKQTLSLMGKKYAVVGTKDSLGLFLKNEPSMSIEFDDKTKKIAGYKCKHAIGTFHNPDFPSFDIYYTEKQSSHVLAVEILLQLAFQGFVAIMLFAILQKIPSPFEGLAGYNSNSSLGILLRNPAIISVILFSLSKSLQGRLTVLYSRFNSNAISSLTIYKIK